MCVNDTSQIALIYVERDDNQTQKKCPPFLRYHYCPMTINSCSTSVSLFSVINQQKLCVFFSNMQQVSCQKIHIWSVPKSGSTVMSKAFACRNDTHSVIEHFLTKRNGDGRRIQDVSSRQADYQWVKTYLDQLSTQHPIVVSKEHAFVYSPWIDLGCFEKYTMDDAQHVILFREPAGAMRSYQFIQETAAQGDVVPEQREEEISFDALKKLYLHTLPNNILIDFADVVKDPKRSLSTLCQKLGISDQSEQMIRWDERSTSVDNTLADPANAIWFQTLRASRGIESTYVTDRSHVHLNAQLEEIVAKNNVIYDFFVERKDILLKD